jgi:hypothetical protein
MREVALSIDVEWAHADVLADTVRLLDERALSATFFCTHAGIDVPGHERALHPNFRRRGNGALAGPALDRLGDDRDWYRRVVHDTQAYCPEAIGVRAHSLFADSDLLPIFRTAGLQYDSSYLMPLVRGLAPASRGSNIVELPIFYMDYWDLNEQVSAFAPAGLRLDRPGLKILAFHPNLIFLNASSIEQYCASKAHYHDPDWLAAHRHPGRGVRTLFVEILDQLALGEPVPVLAEINAAWRDGTAAA